MLAEIKKVVGRVIDFFENSQLSLRAWLVSFVAVIAVRFVVEMILVGFPRKNLDEFVGSLVQGTFLFFLCSYLLLLLVLYIITKEKIFILARVLLWGQWLVVLPPIIDKIIFRDKQYWSYYLFDKPLGLVERFFTFFGSNPSMGITYGTRFMVFCGSVLLGYYIYHKKGKVVWFFVGMVLIYTVLFLLACVPSLIAYSILPFQGVGLGKLESYHIAKLFLTESVVFGIKNAGIKVALHVKLAVFYNIFLFVLLYLIQLVKNKEQLSAIFYNIRFPQMFFNWGLFLIGLGLGFYYFPKNSDITIFSFLSVVNILLAILCAWVHTVFVNDVEDLETDKITNMSRPLVKGVFLKEEYLDYGLIFACLALLSALIVSIPIFCLVVAYLLITWVYSCHPFRLKRFVFIASALSSFVSLFFLISGYLMVSSNQALEMFPWKIMGFLFVVYALVIPIKDLKDIEGDRKNGVYTLPVLVGEENARLFFGGVLFLSYFLSITIIGIPSLLFAAFVFGCLSFWVVVSKRSDPRMLPWWVLAIVFVYAIIVLLKVLK